MNQFLKISQEQFDKDFEGKARYSDIKLPKRATRLSAGYDFFAPFAFTLEPGQSIKIPTGVRVILDEDKFLLVAPRSSLGFKYRLQLDNTVGIIDADYCRAENQGHIFIKITNDSLKQNTLTVKKGDAFAQGIIMSYFLTEDDDASVLRSGGLGSTDRV